MGCAGSKDKDGGVAVPRKGRHGGKHQAAADIVAAHNQENAAAQRDGHHAHAHPHHHQANRNAAGAKPDADGIAAFAPSPTLAQQYAAYIREVRAAGVECGVMRYVSRPHHQEGHSVQENMRRNPPQGGIGPAEGGAAPAKPSDGDGHAAVVSAEPVLDVATPPATARVFQCRPLPALPTIGKGPFSNVMLASMALVRGPLREELHPERPRQPAGSGPADGTATPADGLVSLADVDVAAAADSSSSGERHFLIAMKEIPVLSSQPQSALLAHVTAEVQRWTRLSAYSSRVLRCLQMECVYGHPPSGRDGRKGADAVQHHPAHGSTFHDFDGVSRPDAAGAGADHSLSATPAANSSFAGLKGVFGRRRKADGVKGAGGGGGLDESPAGPLTKIRLYMEFAKYGTLRAFQLREMPEKFSRSYLHELTARAFMREVLLALVDMHEQDCLQYDLNARSIFLLRPIKSVYRTYFPAYISDLPVGPLLRVPPGKFDEAMMLINPTAASAPQELLRQPDSDVGAASPLTDEEGRPRPQEGGAGRGRAPHAEATSPNASRPRRQRYPNREGIEAASPVPSSALHVAHLANLSMVALPPADLLADHEQLLAQIRHNRHNASTTESLDHDGGSGGAASGGDGPAAKSSTQRLTVNVAASATGDTNHDPLSPDLGGGNHFSRSTSYFPQDGATPSGDFIVSSSVVYNNLLREEQPWVRDDYRDFMRQQGYEDCVSLPVPSPHDGCVDYGLAKAVAKLTVRQELAAAQECMQVVPLRDTDAGGIAMVCHDRYDRYQPQQQHPPHHEQEQASGGELDSHDDGSGGRGPLRGDSAGNCTLHTHHRDAVEVGGLSLAPSTAAAPTTAAPPQVIPASVDLSRYVLPGSVGVGGPSGGMSTSQSIHFASPGQTNSLVDGTNGGSPPARGRGAQASAGSATCGRPLQHAHAHSSGSYTSSDNFRGALIRVNHMGAIHRALALTSTCTTLGEVPVHRFVTVTHAAPEVLHRKEFSPASDIYAFAMTFIELVTNKGDIMAECAPAKLPKPRTRKEKDEYDSVFAANLHKWYNSRMDALQKRAAAAAAEQALPDSILPAHPPVCVPLPAHLSDAAKNVLKWCLQTNPLDRPTAVELLRSDYFLFGDWIAGEESSTTASASSSSSSTSPPKTARGVTLPERPWREEGAAESHRSNEMLAQAAGFPLIPDNLIVKSSHAKQNGRKSAAP